MNWIMMMKQMTLLVLILFGTITAVRGTDDFQDVFNGQDLTGWKGKPDLWRVEEGAIVGETVKGKPIPANTFLVWQGGELGDFEFTAQVRFRGNNSGVQYRSLKHDGQDLVLSGYQFDLHPRQNYYGMLYGEKYADRKIIATRGQKVMIDSAGKKHLAGKVGDGAELTDWAWNEIRIVAAGNRLIHEVNGVTAVDVTDDHPTARPTGLLGLQLHRGAPMRVEFKALKLRRLSKEQGRHVLQQFADTKQAPAAPVEVVETNGIPGLVRNLSVAKGFQVELVYTVPRDKQGSWVSLALDGQGCLLASDQGGMGIYRITPGADANATKVEKVPLDLSGAQGMGWRRDALYLFQSRDGLYRVTDSNGDDQLDRAELLTPLSGQGEHGTHAVFDAENGTHFYAVAGNGTPLPDEQYVSGSRVASWGEDLLLPRQWDARGHARGRMAPGGWISLFDLETEKHEVFCIGFRNQYDAALNAHGDLFTYDADMEWDLGLPWYRPTRICHVVSGGDYGWRSGSGKWPSYYEDSLPPLVEIGPGSPTGVVSGRGAKFPARYQHAIFALDWTYGRILAVHVEPDGAGYKADWETFIAGAPLPVTDAVVASDGHLYVITGGRGAQSALLRVRYTGGESTAPAEPAPLPEAARTRRSLEAFHAVQHPRAVENAWPHLASEDRFLRHAARVAIESQPVSQWAGKVFREPAAQARITGAIALARVGAKQHREPLVRSLLELDVENLPRMQQLGLLRAFALAFERFGRPDDEQRTAVIGKLDPLFPSSDTDLNTELLRLLVYLDAPSAVTKGIALLAGGGEEKIPDWTDLKRLNARYGNALEQLIKNPPPSTRIGYAFILRTATAGWTSELRREYFSFLNQAANAAGGASYPGYLTNIRDEALSFCSDEERRSLATLTGRDFDPLPDFPIHPPKGPGREWSLEDALAVASDRQLRGANFENGRSLFYATQCGACHRFNGLGGGVGPDLTSVPLKFDTRYLIEAIINPSKDISDQYRGSTVVLDDGRVLSGLVVAEDEETLRVYPPDPKSTGVLVKKVDIEAISPSDVSQMPAGLIDGLNPKELRDLIAYIMSGGKR